MTKELEIFFNLLGKQSELTPVEIEVQEKYFRTQIYGTPNSGEARAKLKDFFFVDPKDTIEKSKRFWFSYWRWYAMLNWSGFLGLSEADMLFSLAYQVPMAVVLDYNPADELRRYLALNYPYKEDMDNFYTQVQPTFLASEAYVGMWQGKEVYLSQLIKELTEIGFEEDSLRQAEFENKLTQILFSNNELAEKYFYTSSDVAIQRFISLVIFLQSVDEKEIWLAVDNFMYPEKYVNKVLAEISSGTTPSTAIPPIPAAPTETPKPIPVVKSSIPPVPFPKSAPTKPPMPSTPKPAAPPQSAPKKEEPKLIVPPTIRPKPASLPAAQPFGSVAPVNSAGRPSPAQIKSQIESQFKKDTYGNFIDIEGVMAKLNELAEKNNDSKIADMIYYDEKENKFKWNV